MENADLPISDFVNDTKTVMDSVPRLLAAMQFLASNEFQDEGFFEVACQIVRARQLVATKTSVSPRIAVLVSLWRMKLIFRYR